MINIVWGCEKIKFRAEQFSTILKVEFSLFFFFNLDCPSIYYDQIIHFAWLIFPYKLFENCNLILLRFFVRFKIQGYAKWVYTKILFSSFHKKSQILPLSLFLCLYVLVDQKINYELKVHDWNLYISQVMLKN